LKYIEYYNDYESYSNNDLIRSMSGINEKYGTPEILKNIFDDVFKLLKNMIGGNISDDMINLNSSYTTIDNKVINFKKNISIQIKHSDRNDIYSRSGMDSIYFEFNFNSYGEKELRKILLHELLHIYEIYFRMENNKNSLQWSLNSELNNIRTKYQYDNFLSILIYHIYLSYDHEINARVCETYMVLMDLMINDKNMLLDELKSTSAWKYKDILSKFEIKNVNYNNLFLFFKEFNSIIHNKHKVNNNIFRIPNNIKDCKLILNEWKVLFKKKSKYFEQKLIKVVDDVIFDVDMLNITTIDEFSNFKIDYPIDLLRESKIRKLQREK